MKQFKTVFNFELSTLLKNKALIITTVVLSVASFLIATIPTFITWFAPSEEVPPSGEVVSPSYFEDMGFVFDFDSSDVYITALEIDDSNIYASVSELTQAVEAGEVSMGFHLKSDVSYDMISSDISAYNTDQFVFEDIIRSIKTDQLLTEAGIDAGFVHQTMNLEITSNTIVTGKDAGSGMFISYAVLFILYMLILLYGTNVSTSVAREKDSRTMELLITSTKPGTLILGKVLATGLMGIIQVACVIAALALGVFISRGNYPAALLAMIGGVMTLDTALVYIFFSVSGYMLYLFIYAALGSLVSKVEDVNKAVAPITYLFIIAYMVASFAMQMPDSKIVAVSSYIPFISIFTMPIRYMLTSISWISVISSLVIMLVSTGLLASLSIYIYRFGSLNYGNKISLKQVMRSFKTK